MNITESNEIKNEYLMIDCKILMDQLLENQQWRKKRNGLEVVVFQQLISDMLVIVFSRRLPKIWICNMSAHLNHNEVDQEQRAQLPPYAFLP
ncbi:hypothetical protein Glove_553g16 [Diversispora epigaea]|uniref:Uncharacterized protein n=1 Tax=Diversispora epigaea TaxID=1348612 RepID=A0A397GBD0_9GLOM|nr:hypothetical protein Glove_553g16 [Diversispora epigaea]